MPTMISGSKYSVNKKILLALALDPELKQFLIPAGNINDRQTLSNFNQLSIDSKTANSGEDSTSVDTTRGTLLATLNPNTAQNPLVQSFKDLRTTLSRLLSTARFSEGSNVPSDASIEWDELRFYEIYALNEIAKLQKQYLEAMEFTNIIKAKSLLDKAIHFVGALYRPILDADSSDLYDISHRKRTTPVAVYSLVVGTLKHMAAPFYPVSSNALPYEPQPNLKRDHIEPYLQSIEQGELDTIEGKLFFKTVSAIKLFLKNNPDQVREDYHGYLEYVLPFTSATPDLDEKYKSIITEEFTTLVCRVTRTYCVAP